MVSPGSLLSDIFAGHIADEETNVFPAAMKFISEKEAVGDRTSLQE